MGRRHPGQRQRARRDVHRLLLGGRRRGRGARARPTARHLGRRAHRGVPRGSGHRRPRGRLQRLKTPLPRHRSEEARVPSGPHRTSRVTPTFNNR
ncbi:conserved hypothetical protein [Frigoribacterium sp. 9N]|nr:conserved hypothetical protein [Frigoribacterium sp. 9N]